MAERIYLAANNGDIGGGEVMALALARAARDLGRDVAVVAPSGSVVVERAFADDLPVVEIHGRNRRQYMATLRAWDVAARSGVLWCNGLVPAMATAGRRDRIVHVHLLPVGVNQPAFRIARSGARAVLVPSEFVAAQIPGSRVLENWVDEVVTDREPPGRVPATIGFIGRPSVAKGVVVLAEAIRILNARNPDRGRLVVAGDPAFVPAKEQAIVREALDSLGSMVSVTGWQPLPEFFGEVDLAVFPSLVEETFGLVVAEAMSARVPFVISDAGALPEVAGPSHSWVAPSGDALALARAIDSALGDWGTAGVEAAHRRWAERYSPDAGRERLAVLLDELGL